MTAPITPTARATQQKLPIWLLLASLFFVITVVLFAVRQQVIQANARSIAALASQASSSGTDFLAEHRPVRVHLDGFPVNFYNNHPLNLTLSLNHLDTSEINGLADEASGTLTPTLSLTGCNVQPAQALGIRADQPLTPDTAFFWQWSAVCQDSGQHDLHVMLSFSLDNGADPGTSAGIAYQSVTSAVSDDPPFEKFLALITPLSGIVGIVLAGTQIYTNWKGTSA